MPAHSSYDYALVRVVPRVERGERINVGVILFCRTRGFLGCRIHLDEARLHGFFPPLPMEDVSAHLSAIERICAGGLDAGPIGALPQAQRFHWLVSPRSTIVQPSAIHSGLCADPEAALNHLFATMVALPAGEEP